MANAMMRSPGKRMYKRKKPMTSMFYPTSAEYPWEAIPEDIDPDVCDPDWFLLFIAGTRGLEYDRSVLAKTKRKKREVVHLLYQQLVRQTKLQLEQERLRLRTHLRSVMKQTDPAGEFDRLRDTVEALPNLYDQVSMYKRALMARLN